MCKSQNVCPSVFCWLWHLYMLMFGPTFVFFSLSFRWIWWSMIIHQLEKVFAVFSHGQLVCGLIRKFVNRNDDEVDNAVLFLPSSSSVLKLMTALTRKNNEGFEKYYCDDNNSDAKYHSITIISFPSLKIYIFVFCQMFLDGKFYLEVISTYLKGYYLPLYEEEKNMSLQEKLGKLNLKNIFLLCFFSMFRNLGGTKFFLILWFSFFSKSKHIHLIIMPPSVVVCSSHLIAVQMGM